MELLCISTFGEFGKIKNITLNKIYVCRWKIGNKVIIIADDKKPKAVIKNNFVINSQIEDILSKIKS